MFEYLSLKEQLGDFNPNCSFVISNDVHADLQTAYNEQAGTTVGMKIKEYLDSMTANAVYPDSLALFRYSNDLFHCMDN